MNNETRFSTIFLPVLNVFQHSPTQCNREKKGIFYKIKRSPPWNWRRDNGVARRKKLCCPCASFRCASPWTFFDFCKRNPQPRATPLLSRRVKKFLQTRVADLTTWENRGYVPLIEILAAVIRSWEDWTWFFFSSSFITVIIFIVFFDFEISSNTLIRLTRNDLFYHSPFLKEYWNISEHD